MENESYAAQQLALCKLQYEESRKANASLERDKEQQQALILSLIESTNAARIDFAAAQKHAHSEFTAVMRQLIDGRVGGAAHKAVPLRIAGPEPERARKHREEDESERSGPHGPRSRSKLTQAEVLQKQVASKAAAAKRAAAYRQRKRDLKQKQQPACGNIFEASFAAPLGEAGEEFEKVGHQAILQEVDRILTEAGVGSGLTVDTLMFAKLAVINTERMLKPGLFRAAPYRGQIMRIDKDNDVVWSVTRGQTTYPTYYLVVEQLVAYINFFCEDVFLEGEKHCIDVEGFREYMPTWDRLRTLVAAAVLQANDMDMCTDEMQRLGKHLSSAEAQRVVRDTANLLVWMRASATLKKSAALVAEGKKQLEPSVHESQSQSQSAASGDGDSSSESSDESGSEEEEEEEDEVSVKPGGAADPRPPPWEKSGKRPAKHPAADLAPPPAGDAPMNVLL